MTFTAHKVNQQNWTLDLGANHQKNGSTSFKVWAPFHQFVTVEVLERGLYSMHREEGGYFVCEIEGLSSGDLYYYRLQDGAQRPDPVSRALPKGVHGPTQILSREFDWKDSDWKGIELRDAIIYELHVGSFTKGGTFQAVIDKLEYLKRLGINVIEIMPVANFPGKWNWGYDGASLYAPAFQYGGVEGLKTLVNACHLVDIAVCLDVVYNHLGPVGNYLEQFGPYFSDFYHTPWGKAFNYDGAYSDFVREYVIKNSLYWISEYHMDCLRLDAIHGIYDFGAIPMLEILREEVEKLENTLKRKIHVIAESGRNDSKVIKSRDLGGWNYSAVWNDDFHHAAHVALTDERTTYFQDFQGIPDLAECLVQGYVYGGKYSAFRKRMHGNSTQGIPFEKFVIFTQNHDQIGNRPFGERISALINKRRLKLAPFLSLMTPFVPLLFMGEEYGEKAPFEYFVDFDDNQLMQSIFEGRKKEFHREDMPFPGSESFQNSCLTWDIDDEMYQLYVDLIKLRKSHPPKKHLKEDGIKTYYSEDEQWLAWEYETQSGSWLGVLCNFKREKEYLAIDIPFAHAVSKKILFSSEPVALDEKGNFLVPYESALIVQ